MTFSDLQGHFRYFCLTVSVAYSLLLPTLTGSPDQLTVLRVTLLMILGELRVTGFQTSSELNPAISFFGRFFEFQNSIVVVSRLIMNIQTDQYAIPFIFLN